METGLNAFFPGFRCERVSGIHLVRAGTGAPLLLLHGFPETHVAWRKIAPGLAERFHVVAADLRGYGDSHRPRPGGDPKAYTKRAMASELVLVMEALGFRRFSIVGHDRGARVAHRMGLDFPERISKLVFIDILPASDMLARPLQLLASGYLHWFFFRLPRPLPEMILAPRIGTFLRLTFRFRARGAVERAALDAYVRAYSRPGAVSAAIEDYRAMFTIDRIDDEKDADHRITRPVLVLWGDKSPLHKRFGAAGIWRNHGSDLTSACLPGGHFLPEESPGPVASAILRFLTS